MFLHLTGVKALTSLIRTSPKLAMDCQMTVVELLDDPDPGIQTKVGIGCEPQVGHRLSDDCGRTVR